MKTARDLLKDANIGDEITIHGHFGNVDAKVIDSSDMNKEELADLKSLKALNIFDESDNTPIVNHKVLHYTKNGGSIVFFSLESEAEIIKRAEKAIIVNGVAYI